MSEYEDNNLLEVKAVIWEVKKGKPTKLKAMDTIFIPEEKLTVQELKEHKPIKLIQKKSEDTHQRESSDKGEFITNLSGNNIFENILNDIKEGVSKNEDHEQLLDRMIKYYPNAKPSSLNTYISTYNRFLNLKKSKNIDISKDEHKDKHFDKSEMGNEIGYEKGIAIFSNILDNIKSRGNNVHEMERIMSEYYPEMTEKSVKRYVYGYRKYIGGEFAPKSYVTVKSRRKKRRPSGSIGKDDTYGTWIKQDEYDTIKRAINKWGFTPTTEAIADVTGLGIGRVRATLHFMLKKHEIYISREDLTPVYHSVPFNDDNKEKKV